MTLICFQVDANRNVAAAATAARLPRSPEIGLILGKLEDLFSLLAQWITL